MVIDESAFVRMMLRSILQESGLEVVAEASDGKEAIRLFKQVKPDLVMMDIPMPEMDGIQSLNEIRKIDANAKVIMCSALGQQQMIVNVIRAGAKDFLVKPLEKHRVCEAIRKALQ